MSLISALKRQLHDHPQLTSALRDGQNEELCTFPGPSCRRAFEHYWTFLASPHKELQAKNTGRKTQLLSKSAPLRLLLKRLNQKSSYFQSDGMSSHFQCDEKRVPRVPTSNVTKSVASVPSFNVTKIEFQEFLLSI